MEERPLKRCPSSLPTCLPACLFVCMCVCLLGPLQSLLVSDLSCFMLWPFLWQSVSIGQKVDRFPSSFTSGQPIEREGLIFLPNLEWRGLD